MMREYNVSGIIQIPEDNTPMITYNWMGWTVKKIGKSRIYEYQETYAGTPGPITRQLVLEASCKVNKIEQLWSAANAKDATINVFTTANTVYSAALQVLTANVSTSEILQLGEEYKYPQSARLEFVWANYTDADIVRVIVQVDDL